MYPSLIPLVDNLDDIKVPFFALGMGWVDSDVYPNTIYSASFSESTQTLLKRFVNDGFSLGCRDYYSERILHNCGVSNTLMTGCAAWYDLSLLDCGMKNINDIRNICISDPAQKSNFEQFLGIIKLVKSHYPLANIKVIFHRDVEASLCAEINQLGIEIEDISGSVEGIHSYDDCDLHIGYRVHAHIYNLSRRQRSILIEEDSRGAGVNDALGLRSITAYDTKKSVTNLNLKKVKRKLKMSTPRSLYISLEIEDYLRELECNDFIQIKWAIERMRYYYENMEKHILQLY